jgi:hypothetical protein
VAGWAYESAPVSFGGQTDASSGYLQRKTWYHSLDGCQCGQAAFVFCGELPFESTRLEANVSRSREAICKSSQELTGFKAGVFFGFFLSTAEFLCR